MKSQQLKRTLLGALLVSGTLGLASQAHAVIYISPGAIEQVASLSGLPASALQADDLEGVDLLNLNFQLASVYKQEDPVAIDPANDTGAGAAYYETSFNNDLSGGTISWKGPLWVGCPSCYLVVKDGHNDPYAYIFNLGSWDGKETIDLSGFWTDNGSISYVEIFNNYQPTDTPGGLVPEPETYAMLLAGLGLVGFAARRKLSKTV